MDRNKYWAAKLTGFLMSLVGLVVFAVGVKLAFFFGDKAIHMTTWELSGAGVLSAYVPAGMAVLCAVSGIFLIGAGQLVRATVDTAENTAEILMCIKNRN